MTHVAFVARSPTEHLVVDRSDRATLCGRAVYRGLAPYPDGTCLTCERAAESKGLSLPRHWWGRAVGNL